MFKINELDLPWHRFTFFHQNVIFLDQVGT
jgi:hypothetical protein